MKPDLANDGPALTTSPTAVTSPLEENEISAGHVIRFPKGWLGHWDVPRRSRGISASDAVRPTESDQLGR